jgi:predicted kinase
MRIIVLLRGAPGAGKSTFIRQQGLEAYAFSPDTLRLLMGGVVMSAMGRIGINNDIDKKVWQEVERLLNEKMGRGEFIVFDATFQHTRDFHLPVKLAHRHRYQVYCVDFSAVPLTVAIAQNAGRETYKYVPPDVIERAYARIENNKIPKDITVFSYAEFTETLLIDKLEPAALDLNAYRKIHHIGDLQGCFDPVADYFKDGFKDDEFYIFVGDFLDRGIQNGEVIRWIVDEVMERPNVALIWGNHETHIHRYATGQTALSKEFQYNTYPQLQAVNFDKREANRLCSKLRDFLEYHYGDIKCLVTHGGLAAKPPQLALITSQQCWKGTGTYIHPVDETFSETMAGTDWIQVHGHRNNQELPIQASTKSFNLEGKVEFGGHLRVMTLTREGTIEALEIKNNTFRQPNTRKETVNTAVETGKLSQLTHANLQDHEYVKNKNFETHPHIYSYNFTHKAFAKGIWDNISMTARGLFVDTDRHIVARSYNKFFNVEERPETEWRNLQRNLVFPLTLYVKENGFLGLLGYDVKEGKAFFASKSTPDSEFAGWFKDILLQTLGEETMALLTELLRDENLSLVFEVNDPVNDPHMIEYSERHVVLLEAVYRTEKFQRLPFHDLQKLAEAYHLPCKRQGIIFKDWESFKTWHEQVEEQGLNYTFKGKHLEGFVVEDADGFMFKIKLPYYSHWKYLRTVKQRIIKMRESGGQMDLSRFTKDTRAFYEWAITQPNEILAQDIIIVRSYYLASLTTE